MNKLLFSLCLLLGTPWTWAQTTPATTQLDAQASQSVDNDELWVSLSVSREGTNTHDITQAVLAQLQAATAQAKRVDGVQLQIGQVNTTPVWDNKGKTANWSAQAELVLVSKNTAALSQLASDLTRLMRINSVQYRLSNEKRLATEKALIQDMAVNFRDKANTIRSAFGFGTYTIKTLNFSPLPERNFAPAMPLMARAMSADMAPPAVAIPNEGGKSTVSVGMQASIEMQP